MVLGNTVNYCHLKQGRGHAQKEVSGTLLLLNWCSWSQLCLQLQLRPLPWDSSHINAPSLNLSGFPVHLVYNQWSWLTTRQTTELSSSKRWRTKPDVKQGREKGLALSNSPSPKKGSVLQVGKWRLQPHPLLLLNSPLACKVATEVILKQQGSVLTEMSGI